MAGKQGSDGVNDWRVLSQQVCSHVVNNGELQSYRPKKY